MDHLNPHGLVFVALQFVFVLGLAWLSWHWRGRRTARGEVTHGGVLATLVAVLVVEYGVLRTQPFRMGGDPWHYTLGIFDGVSLMGLVLLVVVHRHVAPAPEARAGT